MIEAPAHVRRVEKIPALLVAMMKDADKLPQSGRSLTLGKFGFRFPTLADQMTAEWAAEWDTGEMLDENGIREARGIIGYIDRYDFHTASDVRDIIYIAGTPRAIVHLFRWVRIDAHKAHRRVIGSFDCDNSDLATLVQRLGASKTREVYEA